MSFARVIKKGFKFIVNSDYRFIVLAERGFNNKLDDKTYLERMYKARQGKELDLDHPNTYNEKLQWLKLYDRRPEYTDMVGLLNANHSNLMKLSALQRVYLQTYLKFVWIYMI